MRLNAAERDAIKASALVAFGPCTKVRLFGSRVLDHLRGGDIDLHFEVARGRGTDDEVQVFEACLFRSLEPQRVDKVFTVRGDDLGPFEQIIYRDGVVL